ncbi:unnamed protein product [Sphagnum troendelagicum]
MPTQKKIFPRALDPPLRPTVTESFEIRRHTEDGRASVEMLDGRASRTTTLMSFACASPLSDPIANTLQRQQERKSTGAVRTQTKTKRKRKGP